MKRNPCLILPLLALACGSATLRATPVLIDDFSDDLAPTMSNTYHDGAMLGGELDVSLGHLDAATFEIAGGTGTISGVTETGGANYAQFVYDGDDSSNGFAFGLPSTDLTDGGSNDRFAIDLASVTGTIAVTVRVWEDADNFSHLQIPNVTSAGILEFPFTDFFDNNEGADFAAAKQVTIWVHLDTGEGCEIDSFQSSSAILPLAPVLIDNFSGTLSPIASHHQLDGSMLGGEVDFRFGGGLAGSFAVSGGNGELSGVTADGEFRFFYDGEDNDSFENAHALPDIDLTGGGSNDRIAIDLSSVSGNIDILVRVWEDDSNFSIGSLFGATDPGIVNIFFADFIDVGSGVDFTAVKSVSITISGVDPGEGFGIDSVMAWDATLPPEDDPAPEAPTASAPDTAPPTVKLLKKKKLKTPRPRHTVKGTVSDNDAVARVEVKVKHKGWRKAKLRASGRWKFKTPRLETGRNKFKIRAEDASGNRSRAKKVKAVGR